MFDHTHYVPILKGKAGEFQALRDLDDETRRRLTPLIEVMPVSWDYVNDAPSKPLDEHMAGLGRRILQSWGTDSRLFVDLNLLPEDAVLANGQHPVTAAAADLRAVNVNMVPVTGLRRSPEYQTAVSEVAASDGNGICLRIEDSDLEEVHGMEDTMGSVLDGLGVEPESVDLVIDLNAIGTGQAGALVLAAVSILKSLPAARRWRTLTLAASAFPENLSDVGAASAAALPRAEWVLWTGVLGRSSVLPRMPTFGDYAIAHPNIAEIDPRVMRMSANLRYTADDSWLVLKGRNVRDHGYEQFNNLCAQLVRRPEFSGAAFSAGDAYIARCAAGEAGPGSATTWRQVGTNHHLHFVTSQIASLAGP